MAQNEELEDMEEMVIDQDGTEIVPNCGTELERLEAEGDIAADYLEELLDIAGIDDGDIELDVENGRALVEIVTDEDEPDRRLKRLVGRHGEVLEALQELTRLAVQSQTGERSRLMLDVIGYRAGRRESLRALVEDCAEKVKQTGDPIKLDPMNPFERKVCHDMAAELGLYSESEGVAPNRYVVLSLDAGDDEDMEEDDIVEVDEDSEEYQDDER